MTFCRISHAVLRDNGDILVFRYPSAAVGTSGDKPECLLFLHTRLQILLYTLLLLAVSVLPFAMHMSGYVYLAGALLLGGGFLYYAIRLMQGRDEKVAMQTFGYSIWYLMALFALLLVDHYLPELY